MPSTIAFASNRAPAASVPTPSTAWLPCAVGELLATRAAAVVSDGSDGPPGGDDGGVWGSATGPAVVLWSPGVGGTAVLTTSNSVTELDRRRLVLLLRRLRCRPVPLAVFRAPVLDLRGHRLRFGASGAIVVGGSTSPLVGTSARQVSSAGAVSGGVGAALTSAWTPVLASADAAAASAFASPAAAAFASATCAFASASASASASAFS